MFGFSVEKYVSGEDKRSHLIRPHLNSMQVTFKAYGGSNIPCYLSISIRLLASCVLFPFIAEKFPGVNR